MRQLLFVAALALVFPSAFAMRISPEIEHASLKVRTDTVLFEKHCSAPRGTVVRILGTPTDPGRLPSVDLRIVRVLDGLCRDYEATVIIGLLAEIKPASG